MELISERVQKAAKDHTCSWCLEGIKRGNKYKKYIASDYGEIHMTKCHLCCDDFIIKNKDHCIDFDGFLSDLVTVRTEEPTLEWDELDRQIKKETK